jgi:hypothetical protein
MTPSQIGVVLRDSHGVPQVRACALRHGRASARPCAAAAGRGPAHGDTGGSLRSRRQCWAQQQAARRPPPGTHSCAAGRPGGGAALERTRAGDFRSPGARQRRPPPRPCTPHAPHPGRRLPPGSPPATPPADHLGDGQQGAAHPALHRPGPRSPRGPVPPHQEGGVHEEAPRALPQGSRAALHPSDAPQAGRRGVAAQAGGSGGWAAAAAGPGRVLPAALRPRQQWVCRPAP